MPLETAARFFSAKNYKIPWKTDNSRRRWNNWLEVIFMDEQKKNQPGPLTQPDGAETFSSAYPNLDNDLAIENLAINIPFADIQDL